MDFWSPFQSSLHGPAHCGTGHSIGRSLLRIEACGFLLAFASGAAVAVSSPAGARADPLPVTVSSSGVTLSARVEDGVTRISLATVGGSAETTWQLDSELVEVSLETRESAGRAVLIVRGRGPSMEVAALAEPRPRPRWRWHGRTDLHGDPGERVADAVEVRDVDGDGRDDIIVGQRREGVAACGGPLRLLFARRLDARGRFVPWLPPPDIAHAEPLAAGRAGPAEPTLVRGLRFEISSSAPYVAGEEDASALAPPAGLTDGRGDTGWTAEHPGDFVRARWSGPPIAWLALRGGESAPLSRRFLVAVDNARWLVEVPDGFGEAVRLDFPAPIATSCLSLAPLDAAPSGRAEARTGFAEVEVHSVADNPEGLREMVEVLVRDAPEADRVVSWLATAGGRALAAIDEAWERLGTRGRRRALRAAAGIRGATPSTAPAVRALRVRALADDDPDVRADAVESLRSGSEEDRSALLEAALGDGPANDIAAATLLRGSRLPPDAARHIAAARDFARPVVRRLAADALLSGAMALEALTQSSSGDLAAIALGIDERAARDDARAGSLVDALVARILDRQDTDALDFAGKYRLVRAARRATSERAVQWLETLVREAPEWMLRAAALESLGTRATEPILERALADPYPRVRLAAAIVRATRTEGAATSLLALARNDPWPLVRAFALGEVAFTEQGARLVRDALLDDSSAMRARALEILRTHPSPDAWPAVRAILEDRREWPHVTARAVELAREVCDPSLAPGLLSVLRRGTRERASAADLDSAAAALVALLGLGEPFAAEARALAANGPAAATFAPWLERAPARCTPRPLAPRAR